MYDHHNQISYICGIETIDENMEPRLKVDVSKGLIEHVNLKMNIDALKLLIVEMKSVHDNYIQTGKDQLFELGSQISDTGISLDIRHDIDRFQDWENQQKNNGSDHIIIHLFYVLIILVFLSLALTGAAHILNII